MRPGSGQSWRFTAGVAAVVALPALVLVVSLAQRTWYPTGDQAQAELRMLSIPDHLPLVGAAGRIIADDGTQGNHPGPLMFWTTWPGYRLLGGSSWAFAASTALVNAAGLAASVTLVARRVGRGVTLWWGAVALVLVGGFGLDVLSQPWNPWVALIPFALAVLGTWAVVDGARWPLVLVVAGASYALQGHVGYAPLVPPLVLLATGWLLVRDRPRGPDDRRDALRRLAPIPVAVVVGLALWSGPLADVVRHDPSNVDILLEHFGSPDEEVIGPVDGLRSVLQASSPVGPWVRPTTGIEGSAVPGAVLVVAWAGVAAAVAVRRRDPVLTRLNAVVGLTWVLGVVAVSRVFGELYLYTFRWIVVLAALQVFTLGWGAARLVGERAPRPTDALRFTALAAVLLLSAATSYRVADQDIPYGRSSAATRVLTQETTEKLVPGSTYLVRWEDPVYLGGLAFGLALGLERNGIGVGVDATYAAAAEPHRVLCPGGGFDGVLTVVTGESSIAGWRDRPDTYELAHADVRTDAERRREDADRAAVAAALDLPDPDGAVDGALSLLALSPSDVSEAAARIIEAGVPTSVFLSDPATADC